MIPALNNKESSADLIRASALLANGLASIEEAAALAGMAEDDFVDALNKPEIQRQIETESALMKVSGKLAEARALTMLDRLLVNIESQLDGMPPATATRVAEILLKISGLSERRATEARQGASQKSEGFSITIHLNGEPPIKLGGASTIEGEAVEVVDD